MTLIDEKRFQELRDEVEAFVRHQGEEYATQIEHDRAVPSGLWDDLRDRGYLSLTAPIE